MGCWAQGVGCGVRRVGFGVRGEGCGERGGRRGVWGGVGVRGGRCGTAQSLHEFPTPAPSPLTLKPVTSPDPCKSSWQQSLNDFSESEGPLECGEGTTGKVLRTCALKSRPETGLDLTVLNVPYSLDSRIKKMNEEGQSLQPVKLLPRWSVQMRTTLDQDVVCVCERERECVCVCV